MTFLRSLRRGEQGITLLEVLVVLSILGVAGGVVGLAHLRMEPAAPPDEVAARVAAARAEALAGGRSVTVRIVRDGSAYWATARPDGSVLADAELAVERLTGKATGARRGDAR